MSQGQASFSEAGQLESDALKGSQAVAREQGECKRTAPSCATVPGRHMRVGQGSIFEASAELETKTALNFSYQQEPVNQLGRLPSGPDQGARGGAVQLGKVRAMLFLTSISGNWLLSGCLADLIDKM